MVESHYLLGDIADRLGACIQRGDPHQVIEGISPLHNSCITHISFALDDMSCRRPLEQTKAGAVLLSSKMLPYCSAPSSLVVDHPEVVRVALIALFEEKISPSWGIHPTAYVAQHSVLHPEVSVGPYVVIEEGVALEQGCVIGSGCTIGRGSTLGQNTYLASRVTLYHDVHIGAHTLIHSGAVLGADGFGFVQEQGCWVKIPQIAGVVVGDHVEIGANSCVDRGALTPTVIGDGVKIDNQVQIGHNVCIGDHCIIAGCVAIGGSAVLGKGCVIGGGAGIRDHVTLVDGVVIMGMGLVTRSVLQPGVYASGTGLLERGRWRRSVVLFRHLTDLEKRLKQLERAGYNQE